MPKARITLIEPVKRFITCLRSTDVVVGHMTLDDIITEGDLSVIRMTFRGTHLGDFYGVAPSGMKVKVRIRFRGREIDYVDLALTDLREVAQELADIAIVEQAPAMEGRSVLLVLAPSKPKKK